jgi:CDP-diacylglycerol--serine O-phosphatidyltransferase
VFILLAVIMDSLDGRVARRLEISSELGKELDSLCDLVSFGVAPAMLVYSQVLFSYNHDIGLLAAVFYIVCGAFRLARFNVLNIKDYFVGVPITLAGTIIAIISWFAPHLSGNLILAVLLLMAVLMVSNIKVPKY